ncbi:MAG TPA: hypothetical protein VGM64_18085 [Lacunisphaera sp.]
MQLSLPSIPSSTPVASKPGCAKNSSTPTVPADSADAAADSFDSLLPKNRPAGKPAKAADDKSDSDTEQNAAVLTAGFWMPMVAPVAPTPDPATSLGTASASAGCATGSTGAALADGSATGAGLFPSTNPRAFGTVIQSRIQSMTSPAGSDPETVVSAVSDPTTAATTTPAAMMPAMAAADAAGSQLLAQAVGVPVGVPMQIPGTVPMPAKRSGATTSAISTGKSTSTETGSLSNSERGTAGVSDVTTAVVQVPDPKHSDPDAQSAGSADVASTIPSKEETELSASFGSEVAKAATTLVGGVARKLTNSVQEKIAGLTDASPQSAKNQFAVAEKYFLNTAQKGVATAGPALGTDVAKVNATMAAATAPARQKSDSTNESTTSFVFSAEQAPTATLTLDAPAPVATVRETMAAVISAVDALERRADVQQKSVDLQFNVGNEKLGLRVELRDGTVHTTFQTESPEMNSALSREWHEVVQPALAREIHLAEPVFHSPSTSGNAVPAAGSDSAATAFGHGAQQQREQPKAPPTFASALKTEFYEPASPEAAPAVAPVSNSSQLLNALA